MSPEERDRLSELTTKRLFVGLEADELEEREMLRRRLVALRIALGEVYGAVEEAGHAE